MELLNNKGEKVEAKLYKADENEAEFWSLEPCTQYYVNIYAYLGEDENSNPIFQAENFVRQKVKTLPNLNGDFELKSLKAEIKRDSITVIWDKSELDQCISHEDLQFSVCEKYLNRGTCVQNKTGVQHLETVTNQNSGVDYYMVKFKNLSPCKNYQVIYHIYR